VFINGYKATQREALSDSIVAYQEMKISQWKWSNVINTEYIETEAYNTNTYVMPSRAMCGGGKGSRKRFYDTTWR